MNEPVHKKAWHLPWQGRQVPHALVDITRRCTVSCRSCYNTADGTDKPLDDVKAEIRQLSTMRNLNSISIVGGEPTLHPGLPEIIRFIRSMDLHAELFTNGLALDEQMIARLARSGLDMAFIHLQTGQKRPDLPEAYSLADVEGLLKEKVALLRRNGIDAGLTMTAYRDRPDELSWAIDRCLGWPHLNYLLVTLDRDVHNMSMLEGNIDSGIACCDSLESNGTDVDRFAMTALVETMERERGLLPFCYLGSNIDRCDPRWISFMAVCAYERDTLKEQVSLRASMVEKLYLRLDLVLRGRYPFYTRQHQGMLKLQVVLNSFFGGRFLANLTFLAKSLGKQLDVRTKRILFQSLAYVGSDGQLVHCAHCPDAVLKNGRLVPVCICDRVIPNHP
jgi:radical SAM family protein